MLLLRNIIFVGVLLLLKPVCAQEITDSDSLSIFQLQRGQKVDSLLNLARSNSDRSLKEQLAYLALEEAQESRILDNEIKCYRFLGEHFAELKLRNESIGYYLKLLFILDRLGYVQERSEINYRIGNLIYDEEFYSKALEYFNVALGGDFSNFNQEEKVDIYIKTARSNFNIDNYEEAITWYQKAIDESRSLYDRDLIIRLYQELGRVFIKSRMYDRGKHYYYTLLSQTMIPNSAVRALVLNNLGSIEQKQGNIQEAINYYNQAIKVLDGDTKNAALNCQVNQNLAICFQNEGLYLQSIESGKQALFTAKIARDNELLFSSNHLVARLYYLFNDYYNAIVYNEAAIQEAEKLAEKSSLALALEFQAKLYNVLGNVSKERTFRTQFLETQNELKNKSELKEGQIDAQRLAMEQLERDALLFEKRLADEELENQKVRTQLEEQRAREALQAARESRLEEEKARALVDLNIERSKRAEYERNLALNKLREDSIQARQDSIRIMLSQRNEELAKQNALVAEQKARNARSEAERWTIIGILLLVLVIFIIFGLVYQRRINSRLSEANKLIRKNQLQLANEKERTEQLLLNILPKQTAEELKEKNKVEPRTYESVSVMFTDFIGFTKIASEMDPADVIHELDRFFQKFDEIVEKYNLERIKTMGDAYMCAGGIPAPNTSHPNDIVSAALEILDYMLQDNKQRNKEGKAYWKIRIGIHTGPIVAGVIGNKKFAYDIWGDTVNTASRMESSALPNSINISGDTYRLIEDDFECFNRGEIQVKNKGKVEMYVVEQRKVRT